MFFGLLNTRENIAIRGLREPRKLSKTEQVLARSLKDISMDEQEVRAFRAKNRQEMAKLFGAMERAEGRTLKSLQQETLADLRKYEAATRRQLRDLMKVVSQAQVLVKNEFIEIVYDVRMPLCVFEKFFRALKQAVKHVTWARTEAQVFNDAVNAVDRAYQELVALVVRFLQQERALIDRVSEGRADLATHLQNRALLKKQINGKTQWIISQIKQLEKRLRQSTSSPIEKGKQLAVMVASFRHQFVGTKEVPGLLTFCVKRVEVADHSIAEAIRLQQAHYKEAFSLGAELKKFYNQFISDQNEVLRDDQTSDTKKRHAEKRRNQFATYKKEIADEFRSFQKAFGTQLGKVQRSDLAVLRGEKKTMTRTATRLRRWGARAGRLVQGVLMLTTAVTVLSGAALASRAVADPSVQGSLQAAAVDTFAQVSTFIVALLSVDASFAERYGENSFQYKLTHEAVSRIQDPRKLGTKFGEGGVGRAVKKMVSPLLTKYKETDCIRFVNDCLRVADPSFRAQDRMDKIIALYKKKGWAVYFVAKDLEDKSMFLRGQSAGDFYRSAKRGTYPFVGKIDHFVIGEAQVADFQKRLKDKVALVSFNTGIHSALILDGKVVQAHYETFGGTAIEGIGSFQSHLSKQEKGIWEFAVVAIAPG